MLIQNLKAAGLVDDRDKTRVIIEKPFGTDLQSVIIYSQWWKRSLREKQVYRIDHYLGKDTVNNILIPVLAILYWNHFGTGTS